MTLKYLNKLLMKDIHVPLGNPSTITKVKVGSTLVSITITLNLVNIDRRSQDTGNSKGETREDSRLVHFIRDVFDDEEKKNRIGYRFFYIFCNPLLPLQKNRSCLVKNLEKLLLEMNGISSFRAENCHLQSYVFCS